MNDTLFCIGRFELLFGVQIHFMAEVKRFTREPMKIVNETLIHKPTDAINHRIVYRACERQCMCTWIHMLKPRRLRIVMRSYSNQTNTEIV